MIGMSITCAIIPPFIEWQKPRTFTTKFSAHSHLSIINSKVHCASSKLEEKLLWIAVSLVLLNSIFNGLLSQAVLQFKRGER